MNYKFAIESPQHTVSNEAPIEEKLHTAKEMFKGNLKIDKIVQCPKLPLDQVSTNGLQGGYIIITPFIFNASSVSINS